ncbi:hypothetical protein ACQ4PT_072337 [Festuca glaucescens]
MRSSNMPVMNQARKTCNYTVHEKQLKLQMSLYNYADGLQMGLHLQNGSKNRTRKQCNSPSKTPKISEPPYFVVIRFVTVHSKNQMHRNQHGLQISGPTSSRQCSGL